MKIAAHVLRFALITTVSLLGGIVFAFLYLLVADWFPLRVSPWMPIIVGIFITNFLARWWSYRHPPRFSDAWEDARKADEF